MTHGPSGGRGGRAGLCPRRRSRGPPARASRRPARAPLAVPRTGPGAARLGRAAEVAQRRLHPLRLPSSRPRASGPCRPSCRRSETGARPPEPREREAEKADTGWRKARDRRWRARRGPGGGSGAGGGGAGPEEEGPGSKEEGAGPREEGARPGGAYKEAPLPGAPGSRARLPSSRPPDPGAAQYLFILAEGGGASVWEKKIFSGSLYLLILAACSAGGLGTAWGPSRARPRSWEAGTAGPAWGGIEGPRGCDESGGGGEGRWATSCGRSAGGGAGTAARGAPSRKDGPLSRAAGDGEAQSPDEVRTPVPTLMQRHDEGALQQKLDLSKLACPSQPPCELIASSNLQKWKMELREAK